MDVPAERGLTFYEVLTLASLVEKEAILDEERPLIAGVYQNRLDGKLGHRLLQADPTRHLRLRHGPAGRARLRRLADVHVLGPSRRRGLAEIALPPELEGYNTYRNAGLPPGPIARRRSPRSTRPSTPDTAEGYVFFLAKNDGSDGHAFAKNQGGARGEPREVRLPMSRPRERGWPSPADFAAPPTAADLARWAEADRAARPARLDAAPGAVRGAGVDAYFGVRRENMRYLTGFVLGDGEEKVAGHSGQFLVGGERGRRPRRLALHDPGAPRGARRADRGRRLRPAGALGDRSSSRSGRGASPSRPGSCRTRSGGGSRPRRRTSSSSRSRAGSRPIGRSRSRPSSSGSPPRARSRIGRSRRCCRRSGRAPRSASLALELEWLLRTGGAEAVAFDPTCLVGPKAALPHGSPSDARSEPGSVVLFDFGAQVDGYRSDMTRTLFVGEPTERDLAVYELVAAAQAAAIDAARGDRSGRSSSCRPDATSTALARGVIEADGRWPAYRPRPGPRDRAGDARAAVAQPPPPDAPLPSPTVFCVEPGIYLEGETGVRIEDLVLLDAGAGRLERLTLFPRDAARRRRLSRQRSTVGYNPDRTDRPIRRLSAPGSRRAAPGAHTDMISTGDLQEGRRHRARRRALADPRLPPHQDGPRLGPGPDHAPQHQARPDGRALVPGGDEVAARLDGEAAGPVPLPRRRRLPLHGQRHVRPVRPDDRPARRGGPVPEGRDDARPDELPGRDDRRRAAGHRRPRRSPRPSPASPATRRPAPASRPRPRRASSSRSRSSSRRATRSASTPGRASTRPGSDDRWPAAAASTPCSTSWTRPSAVRDRGVEREPGAADQPGRCRERGGPADGRRARSSHRHPRRACKSCTTTTRSGRDAQSGPRGRAVVGRDRPGHRRGCEAPRAARGSRRCTRDDAELDVPPDELGRAAADRWIVAAMITHDAYHAGEINHLRSLLDCDDRWRSSSAASSDTPRAAGPAMHLRMTDQRRDGCFPAGTRPGTGSPCRRDPAVEPARRPARSGCGSWRQRGRPRRPRGGPADERLRDVWVEGEVGRVTVSSAGHAYFTLKDERSALQCVWFRDERVRSAFQPQAGPPDRRPRPGRPVRAAGRAPALRRVDPAGGVRRPGAPLRGAQGEAHPGGPVRLGPQAAAPAAPDDDRRRHEPDRRRLARHRPRPRAPLAADPRRPRRLPGPGRGGAGEHRLGVPPARALDRAVPTRRAGPTTRRR